MVSKWQFLLIHKKQTNLWIKLPTIPPGLAGKIVKYLPLSEPINQDLEDSARSQAWIKINQVMDARLKFGQHKRSVRVAQDVAESNSSFLSAFLTSRVHP